jgi:Zn-dependent peptidase ImmA (M78 family)
LRRGFKALAERKAAAARVALGLAPTDPLDAWAYAAHLQVLVESLANLQLPATAIRQLTQVDPDSWSAMTLRENDIFLIVLNPTHARTRQQNDLMHELGHIDLKHTPARVDVSSTGLMLLSDYADEQEQEADWYAGAFLLPRDAILQLRGQGCSALQIASLFNVSEALCEWRIRMTGVDVQVRRRGH